MKYLWLSTYKNEDLPVLTPSTQLRTKVFQIRDLPLSDYSLIKFHLFTETLVFSVRRPIYLHNPSRNMSFAKDPSGPPSHDGPPSILTRPGDFPVGTLFRISTLLFLQISSFTFFSLPFSTLLFHPFLD